MYLSNNVRYNSKFILVHFNHTHRIGIHGY